MPDAPRGESASEGPARSIDANLTMPCDGHARGRRTIYGDVVSPDVWTWPTSASGRVPRHRSGELRGDARGTAAPPRPQPTAVGRQGRRGQQGSGLPVGKRKAKTLASVLATNRATATLTGNHALRSTCRLTNCADLRSPAAPVAPVVLARARIAGTQPPLSAALAARCVIRTRRTCSTRHSSCSKKPSETP